ncbi:hypothetical protein GCM10009740_02440 [Terrabacter terrae]|uniref:Teneurin-like YD-shell domain-containing protein n=1 Tax=Terrabacter terrae TaxID=318434 RepID=A0ABN2TRA8_9MICO
MAHTHTDYDSSGRISGTWTSRNSSDTTRVFDTTYCYVTVAAGAPCPVSTATSNPTKGLIQWSQDNLTAARSIYSYDKANRLTGVTNYGGHSYGYSYDANGNRLTATRDGVQTQSLTFNTGNQISTAGYGYDMAGNTTTAPAAGTLTYNGAGQMATQHNTTTDTTYTYAGPGQNELVTRKVTGGDTTKYVYGRNTKHGVPGIDIIIVNGNKTYLDNDPDGTPWGWNYPPGRRATSSSTASAPSSASSTAKATPKPPTATTRTAPSPPSPAPAPSSTPTPTDTPPASTTPPPATPNTALDGTTPPPAAGPPPTPSPAWPTPTKPTPTATPTTTPSTTPTRPASTSQPFL